MTNKDLISTINRQMQKLVLYRGTKTDIVSKLKEIGLRHDPFLEEFENPITGNDFGFNTNLGRIEDNYLDFEIYLLPTNIPDTFIITEVSAF